MQVRPDRAIGRYIGAVAALGAAVLIHSAWALWRQPPPLEALVLVALTVVSGLATLKLPGLSATFSISDTFTISAALLFGAPVGAAAAAIEGLVITTRIPTNRRKRFAVPFNVATPAVAMWISARIVALIVGRDGLLGQPVTPRLMPPLAAFALLYFLLNTMLVARLVAFERGGPLMAIWRAHFSRLWLSYAGGTMMGALLLALRIDVVRTFLIALPVPVILYFAFKHAVGRVEDHLGHLAEINRLHLATIETLAYAIDAKDQVTHGHIRRVQRQAVQLAGALGIEAPADIQAIEAAALLHDMGKIAVPDHILNKPGALTPAEYEVMKQHAPIGADILSNVAFPFPVVPIVRHHHESWDGSGYPDGLRGAEIPIGARILSVVDCFDALTSDRPYRRAMTRRQALDILRERSGRMYDPAVVTAFARMNLDEMTDDGDPMAERMLSIKGAIHALSESAGAERDEGDALLAAAFELGTALAATADPDEALAHVARAIGAEASMAAVVWFAYDPETDSLVARSVRGDESARLRRLRIRLGEGVSGWVAANRRPMINSDARLDLQERAQGIRRMPVSALAVPMLRDSALDGVLTAYGLAPNQFNERNQRILALAARALAARPPVRAVA